MNKTKPATVLSFARACIAQSKLLKMRRILHRFRPKSESDATNYKKGGKKKLRSLTNSLLFDMIYYSLYLSFDVIFQKTLSLELIDRRELKLIKSGKESSSQENYPIHLRKCNN